MEGLKAKNFYMTEVIKKKRNQALWRRFCSQQHRLWCDCNNWWSHVPRCKDTTKEDGNPYIMVGEDGLLKQEEPIWVEGDTDNTEDTKGEDNLEQLLMLATQGEYLFSQGNQGKQSSKEQLEVIVLQ